MRLKGRMENNETHIIQRILRGETALYEYFLNQHGQQVFSLIARIICNQEDAEELTQDVFLKAFQHLSSFKAESSFSTWIYSIAYNTAISATRKKKFDTFAMDDTLLANISDQQVDETLNDESEEMIIRLNRAIEKLNSDERALITLFYYEEKSLNETALILGLTESNAKVKLHRLPYHEEGGRSHTLTRKEIGTKNAVCYDSRFHILNRMLHCRISDLFR